MFNYSVNYIRYMLTFNEKVNDNGEFSMKFKVAM